MYRYIIIVIYSIFFYITESCLVLLFL